MADIEIDIYGGTSFQAKTENGAYADTEWWNARDIQVRHYPYIDPAKEGLDALNLVGKSLTAGTPQPMLAIGDFAIGNRLQIIFPRFLRNGQSHNLVHMQLYSNIAPGARSSRMICDTRDSPSGILYIDARNISEATMNSLYLTFYGYQNTPAFVLKT